jgi:subtilisin family serine protease
MAQVPIRALARATSTDPSAMWTDRTEVSAIVELPKGDVGTTWGLPRIGTHFSVVHGTLADLDALAAAHADWKMSWSPPLRPLLDRAAEWVHAPSFHDATGLTGKGVVVGIVDTGADCAHPDLRNADGSTRIAYLIDFDEAPSHPPGTVVPDEVSAAEDKCASAKLKCAVRTAADIDRELGIQSGAALPTDTIGHGTHVASIAAGNGGAEGKYVGIAPESSLIVVRALNAKGDLTEANVLVGTELVFSLAESMGSDGKGLPAVVNLSLGSDAGPHDGTSAPLERGLGDLVGDQYPGRAIVVAAGNSAGLAATRTGPPDRLGVHTDVSIPERSRVDVPLVLHPAAGQTTELSAGMDVYVAFRAGDDVSVGVDRNGAEWIAPRSRGFSGS